MTLTADMLPIVSPVVRPLFFTAIPSAGSSVVLLSLPMSRMSPVGSPNGFVLYSQRSRKDVEKKKEFLRGLKLNPGEIILRLAILSPTLCLVAHSLCSSRFPIFNPSSISKIVNEGAPANSSARA